MRRLAGLVAAAGALGIGPAAAGPDDPPQPALARPAVDASLFRDGEVHRRNEMHGRWSLDCDEIPRLAQRFCSLRSLALDRSGTPVARITISTDDAGRPAALIDLPAATSLAQPVTVTAGQGLVLGQPTKPLEQEARRLVASGLAAGHGHAPGAGVATPLLSARFTPSLCDAQGCHAVWGLAPADVAALRAGAGLRVRFGVVPLAGGAFPLQAALARRDVEGTVSSDGFGDAIAASVR